MPMLYATSLFFSFVVLFKGVCTQIIGMNQRVNNKISAMAELAETAGMTESNLK